jgi:hypothetical protein
MTHRDEFDLDCREGDPEYFQRLLILAYTRLFLLPERADGSKLTTIASFAPYEIRLVEIGPDVANSIPPLWIEIHNTVSGRVLDSAGCWDLQQAGVATEAFIAEVGRLNGFAD